ncbi:MAG: hypothetical protein EON58_04235 [Alphaproteobacteria bacterium]|nr:MAG: hypothetical protein EON58_04235 [Alphaproteobacteria bacterium]
MDRFEEFMGQLTVELSHWLGQPVDFGAAPHTNISPERNGRLTLAQKREELADQLGGQLLARFQSANIYDYDLYDLATKLAAPSELSWRGLHRQPRSTATVAIPTEHRKKNNKSVTLIG